MSTKMEWEPPNRANIFILSGEENGIGRQEVRRQLRQAVVTLLPGQWFEIHELQSGEFESGHDHYMLERVGGPPVGSFHLWRQDGRVAVEALAELGGPVGLEPWQGWFPTVTDAVRAVGAAIDAQFRAWMLPAIRPKAQPQDGVLIELRPDLIRTHVSSSCHAIMGYKPEDMIGRHPRSVVHRDDWPHLELIFELCRRSNHVVSNIHRFWHADGRFIWVQGDYTPYPDGGYAILLHDVTGDYAPH